MKDEGKHKPDWSKVWDFIARGKNRTNEKQWQGEMMVIKGQSAVPGYWLGTISGLNGLLHILSHSTRLLKAKLLILKQDVSFFAPIFLSDRISEWTLLLHPNEAYFIFCFYTRFLFLFSWWEKKQDSASCERLKIVFIHLSLSKMLHHHFQTDMFTLVRTKLYRETIKNSPFKALQCNFQSHQNDLMLHMLALVSLKRPLLLKMFQWVWSSIYQSPGQMYPCFLFLSDSGPIGFKRCALSN